MKFSRRKPKSKVDQALSIAKQNKKKLSAVSEIISSGTGTAVTVFSSTPIIKFIDTGGEGFKTLVKSVQVRGSIKQDPASTVVDDYRLDLVLDREPAGTVITPLLYLGSATPNIGEFKNHLYKRRYKILRSHTGGFDEAAEGRSIDFIDWYVKLNLIAETKSEGSYSQSNIQKNALYLVYWTKSAANQPVPSISYKINYLDSGT